MANSCYSLKYLWDFSVIVLRPASHFWSLLAQNPPTYCIVMSRQAGIVNLCQMKWRISPNLIGQWVSISKEWNNISLSDGLQHPLINPISSWFQPFNGCNSSCRYNVHGKKIEKNQEELWQFPSVIKPKNILLYQLNQNKCL